MCQEQGFDIGEFLAVSGNGPDGVQTCMAIGGPIEHISDWILQESSGASWRNTWDVIQIFPRIG